MMRDERGSAAVEFAFVAPILILLLVGISQFGMLFFLRSEMLDVARETARRLATGNLTADGAEAWVAAQLPDHADLSVAVTSPSGSNDMYTVTLSLPLASAVPVDPFGFFTTGNVTAAVSMRDEAGAS